MKNIKNSILTLVFISFSSMAALSMDILEEKQEYRIPNKILLDGCPWESDVCDQGQKSTCASHAVCDLLKYCYGKSDIMPLDLHRDAHRHLGTTANIDSTGHHIADLMEFVRDSKRLFQTIINISSSDSDILGDTEVKRIKNVLLNYRLPVVIGVVSTEDDKQLFIQNTRKLPDHLNEIRPEEPNKIRLGHGVIVYGYSDKEQGFLIKNSWGTNFLSRGKAILSYNYFTEKSLNTSYTGWKESYINTIFIDECINQYKVLTSPNLTYGELWEACLKVNLLCKTLQKANKERNEEDVKCNMVMACNLMHLDNITWMMNYGNNSVHLTIPQEELWHGSPIKPKIDEFKEALKKDLL